MLENKYSIITTETIKSSGSKIFKECLKSEHRNRRAAIVSLSLSTYPWSKNETLHIY
jgi:hypothetical protein